MKLNPLITESVVFKNGLPEAELNTLKSKLNLNPFERPIRYELHSTDELEYITYAALFCDSVFYVIRYPNALKDPTEYMDKTKNNTFDVFCFPYSTITGMAVAAPNEKQFVRPCLFIGFPESEDIEFAMDSNSDILYEIMSLYHTSTNKNGR